jgi:single-stranded DNA-binding protein
MASFNKVILLGNVTRDPEIRYTPKGTAVTELGMAMNRVYTTESGEKREAGAVPAEAGGESEEGDRPARTSGGKPSTPPSAKSAPAEPDEDEIPF